MKNHGSLVLLIALLTSISISVFPSRVRAQDLTSLLSHFFADLRAGTLGVLTPITSIVTSGNVTAANVVFSGTISTAGQEFGRTTANGIWQFGQNSASAGTLLVINTGTSNPTATTCGTGTVTPNSNNAEGEIVATGATTCTLTFGTPNWPNAPNCVVTDETTAAALRISARSVSAITVTGLTSGDTFEYICLGGA